LYYPTLDEEQAMSIWEVNLQRTLENKTKTLHADETMKRRLQTWALRNMSDPQTRKIIWNGRQIRNAFSTAAALAEFEAKATGLPLGEKAPLEPKFFDVVMMATKAFDKYLLDTKHGQTDEERASQLRIRAAEPSPPPMTFGVPNGAGQLGVPPNSMGRFGMQQQTPYMPQTPSPSPYQMSFGQQGQQPQYQGLRPQSPEAQRMGFGNQMGMAGQQFQPQQQQQQGMGNPNAYQGMQPQQQKYQGLDGGSQPSSQGQGMYGMSSEGSSNPQQQSHNSQATFQRDQNMRSNTPMAGQSGGYLPGV
jgi:hypothetical protein